MFYFRPSEHSESIISSNGNVTTSPSKRASPRKAVGKENTTPKSRPPVTKRKPTPKGKTKAQPASTSKAASSRRKPAQEETSEESEQEETPQRPKTNKATTAAQKKGNKAPPPPESESEDETPSPEPQNRSSRSLIRQPRAPSAPTPKPAGKPAKKAPVKKSTAQPAPPAKKVPAKPVGAARRKQTIPVLREMQRLQSSTECQIPRAPFSRLVRELMERVELRGAQMRITPQALEALRESSESFLVQVFSDAYLITLNRKQVTLAPKDIQLVMFLRGPPGVQARY